jgi:hypothetical protein
MVNLDELRKKYDQIQKAQSGGGGNDDFLKKFFMMEEGTSLIRVLPSPEGTEQEFYAETAIHRINDKNYHCPRVKGHDCPVCDLYYRLWKVEGPMKDEAQDLARQIKPRKRYYMNVVDRRDESVKILSMGMKLFGKILDCFFDEDYGDITNLTEGWDFKVVKDTQGQWPNYDKSAPKPKQTAAGSDKQIAEWMDELHDIHGLVKLPEYDELKNLAMEMETLVTGRPTGNVSTPAASDDEGDEDYIAHLKSLKSN